MRKMHCVLQSVKGAKPAYLHPSVHLTCGAIAAFAATRVASVTITRKQHLLDPTAIA